MTRHRGDTPHPCAHPSAREAREARRQANRERWWEMRRLEHAARLAALERKHDHKQQWAEAQAEAKLLRDLMR